MSEKIETPLFHKKALIQENPFAQKALYHGLSDACPIKYYVIVLALLAIAHELKETFRLLWKYGLPIENVNE